jgi:uncharacterized protein (DUF608 family)
MNRSAVYLVFVGFFSLNTTVFGQDPDNKPTLKNANANSARSYIMSAEKKGYSHSELFTDNKQRSFSGKALTEVAFPLGGIGAGNVSLGGRGQLRDWEIFNRPAKGRTLPYTFFSIWARPEGGQAVARVLEARRTPPYSAAFGLSTGEVAGLPRLADAQFRGEYPFAWIDFIDDVLPLNVSLEAFTPFIPLDSKNSSIPTAIFRWKVKNPTSRTVKGTIAFSLLNPIGIEKNGQNPGNCYADYFGQNLNQSLEDKGFRGLLMTSKKYSADTVQFGSLSLVTTHDDVNYAIHWERVGWWDDIQKFWDDFKRDGRVEQPTGDAPSPQGRTDVGSLGLVFSLKPGESKDLIFVLTWYFPNRVNYWDPEPEVKGKLLKNWYGTQWSDAWDVARYVMVNFEYLEGKTRLFHDKLFSSTLPGYVLDAVSSQASIMATTTGLRLSDDKFYAFEGCGNESGCCPMNCTHVWNYEQAVAHLYPDLERTMRMTDFGVNTDSSGKMVFRTKVPTGLVVWQFRPAADGQMGTVMKLFREWKLSGDEGFLKALWPAAKRAVEFAWDHWDKDKDGVMEDEQHNTYDIEFFGLNTMTSSFYLGALRAAEEMAQYLGDEKTAKKYRAIYEKGKAKIEKELFNGEFYIQKYDASKAPRYQYGAGCLADQLLGQWFGKVVGLGYLLEPEHVKQALSSVFRYNWLTDLSAHENVQRVYALNDEKGLILCSWPRGGRPALPFPYSDEVWTGIEYQVAAHLIYEGFVSEGLSIVRGVRERYDGERRNPWNEVECGNHYARAMSSWSVLLALSGYQYDAVAQNLSFAPCVSEEDFCSFFSTGSGWGTFRQYGKKGFALDIDFGTLTLKSIDFGCKDIHPKSISINVNEKEIACKHKVKDGDLILTFSRPLTLNTSDKLTVKF